MKKRIRVLLVDDHVMVREGMQALLKVESDIEVIGGAKDGREAVEMTIRLGPEVVVMDIVMPLLNGLEATRQILKARPETKVCILSGHDNDDYVSRAISSGAAGFLLKRAAAYLLRVAIRAISERSEFYGPEISNRLIQLRLQAHERGEQEKYQKMIKLSSREVEVLQLIAEGKANKEVAVELEISIKTVEKHRQSVMEKTNIHDTAGLTRYAIEMGIIECSGPGREG